MLVETTINEQAVKAVHEFVISGIISIRARRLFQRNWKGSRDGLLNYGLPYESMDKTWHLDMYKNETGEKAKFFHSDLWM